ncbi:MAG: tannase, partial [Ruminococcus sp.]|nr:tannase [Ruminococcus sp.]
MKRVLSLALSAVMITAFAGCGQNSGSKASQPKTTAQTEPATTIAVKSDLPKPDNSKWQYLPNEKIYYQLGIDYCEKPADEKYEKLSIFVPAEYMDATDNGDGTYTCSEKKEATVGSYTSADAPIVMPIETRGYYAAEALTSDMPEEALNYFLDKIKECTSKGMVYIFPGCRGIDEGAPSGVTDLKAAVRYIRYCDDELAGDANRIFAFGMSGGGAQAAILGASGNSELYDPYLKEIGAVQGVSDEVAGVMAWCPITDLDTANAEYEWMMGCTCKDRPAEENAISDELAKAF